MDEMGNFTDNYSQNNTQEVWDKMPSGKADFMELLVNINAKLCATNESIKKLNKPIVH